MTKPIVSMIALAALVALGLPSGGAAAADAKDPIPATATSEAHMKAKNAYQNALTDCKMLDNPDRRQRCAQNAEDSYEAMVEEADEKMKR